MPTLPLSGRRPAPARRQLLAVLTAAFIAFQQFILLAPAASAQTRRATTIARPTATKTQAESIMKQVSAPALGDDLPAPSINVNTLGTPITQNFDTLPASGSATWTNDSTLPGWYHARTGTGTTIVANNGSSNAGNLYSYGCTSAVAPCNVAPNATTDRALGSLGSGNAAIGNLFWGIRLTNNTGATITSLDVSYVGEQWRNSAAAAQTVAFSYLVGSPTVTGSLAEFQSAGVAVAALDFTSPITGGSAGELNGNLAANRTAKTATISGLNIPNGTEIMLRWSDPDHTGADHGLSIDDFSVTANGTATPTPTFAINDVSQDEGNAGTTAFTFTVSLNSSTHSGVTFDICTVDGTAQDGDTGGEDTDYAFTCLGSQTIPNGSDSYQFTVNVNGDTTNEPNETFFVNTANVVGATVTDGQGQGTIVNDDLTLTPIHDIQGNGAASPLDGQIVTTRGIVTLLKTGQNTGASSTANGFFLQEAEASYDADPNTSEGIFVFTSTVPAVAVGDEVRVTGTVDEFNDMTELTTVTSTSVISTGNPLPSDIEFTPTELDPTAAPSQPQLEKYEGMRVCSASGGYVTISPNDNFFDVYAVLVNVARPLREPGIPSGNPIPPDPTSGTPDPNIPIWDRNPEKLKIDTNGRAGAANVAYTSNVTLSVIGPLDYAFGEYRLVVEADPSASPNMTAVPVPAPDSDEFTVAGYNIENFNNNATQRQKAALTVRTLLHYPDIIGAVEIFDLADLQALRDQINNDAIANSDPNPLYEAYLVEQDGTSEDSDQDVGFLVKSSRVQVNSVTQEREEETYINPNTGNPETLHDRPPFVLDATVDPSGTNPQHVIVVVNHLRSFIDIELVAGEGPRVRAKRKAQAESLADLLNDLQTANPGVPVISVGDYNAFEFNNGYDDPLSVIKGSPTADDQIVVDQSPDLVNPNFFNLIETLPAAERYSFYFSDDGAMQALDHHVVNAAARSRNTRTAIARVNADFPENPPATYASNAATPERNSDHDPVVSYYSLGAPAAAGSLIISEFRFRGPGLGAGDGGEVSPVSDDGGPAAPGTEQDNDEFVELYNNTDSDITVTTIDGSAGWAVVAADGVTRFIIPNDTVIPARGHFLAVNGDGYSLNGYAQGDDVYLPSDTNETVGSYNLDIPDGSGIALFGTANPANYALASRLDAAGYASVDPLYREGAGFPGPGAEATNDLQHSFVRKVCVFGGPGCSGPGTPKDTSDNGEDFVVVNTEGSAFATTLGSKLGAPGPEGLTSPINGNAGMPAALLDPSVSASQPPNRVRSFTPVTNGTFGTLSIRRTITNNTGSPVRYLAFRIIDVTTNPVPAGTADIRALDSGDIEVTVNGNPVDVLGTFVEEPPDQPNGGGLNSSMAVGTIDLDNQLEDGDSVSVQFLLGIMQTGSYRFYVNIEMINDGLVPEGPAAFSHVTSMRKYKKQQQQQGRQRPRRATR
ncbi:MAG: hypothetical protein ABW208_25960 [Pyrinomonadaceae bacterium]